MSGPLFSKVIPQRLELLFDKTKTIAVGEKQIEMFKIDKIGKFGCFAYWLKPQDLTKEMTILTLDKHNGMRTKFVLVFQAGNTSSELTLVPDVKNKLIRIMAKDIKKDMTKDDWLYIQMCTKSKKFTPYIKYKGGE
jgi:hypothetical protein